MWPPALPPFRNPFNEASTKNPRSIKKMDSVTATRRRSLSCVLLSPDNTRTAWFSCFAYHHHIVCMVSSSDSIAMPTWQLMIYVMSTLSSCSAGKMLKVYSMLLSCVLPSPDKSIILLRLKLTKYVVKSNSTHPATTSIGNFFANVYVRPQNDHSDYIVKFILCTFVASGTGQYTTAR